MLVRYEDLLEDTAGGVLRMASFLGIEPLPVMTQPTANGIPTPTNNSFDVSAIPPFDIVSREGRFRTRVETP
jgi:hypothetical protein